MILEILCAFEVSSAHSFLNGDSIDVFCGVKKVQTYRVDTLWKWFPRVLGYPGYPQKVHFDALGDSKL